MSERGKPTINPLGFRKRLNFDRLMAELFPDQESLVRSQQVDPLEMDIDLREVDRRLLCPVCSRLRSWCRGHSLK